MNGETAIITKIWNKAVVGHRFTTEDIRIIIGYNHKGKNIASIFCKFVGRKVAIRGAERGLYIKVRDYKPLLNRKES